MLRLLHPEEKRRRMTRTRWTVAALTVLIALAMGLQAVRAQSGSPATPAAKVGDEVITLQELEQSVRPQLAKLEEQRHALLEERLDQLIGERLLAQEAKKRGIPADQLLKTEVYGKA